MPRCIATLDAPVDVLAAAQTNQDIASPAPPAEPPQTEIRQGRRGVQDTDAQPGIAPRQPQDAAAPGAANGLARPAVREFAQRFHGRAAARNRAARRQTNPCCAAISSVSTSRGPFSSRAFITAAAIRTSPFPTKACARVSRSLTSRPWPPMASARATSRKLSTQSGNLLPIYDPNPRAPIRTSIPRKTSPTRICSTCEIHSRRTGFPYPASTASRESSSTTIPAQRLRRPVRPQQLLRPARKQTANGMISKLDHTLDERHRLTLGLSFLQRLCRGRRWFPTAADPGAAGPQLSQPPRFARARLHRFRANREYTYLRGRDRRLRDRHRGRNRLSRCLGLTGRRVTCSRVLYLSRTWTWAAASHLQECPQHFRLDRLVLHTPRQAHARGVAQFVRAR